MRSPLPAALRPAPTPVPPSFSPSFCVPALRAALVAALALPLMAACLPASGPSASAIRAESDGGDARFAVVALDAPLADRLAVAHRADLAALGTGGGTGGGAPDLRIGAGDQVAVTIFEAASGGLFSGDPGATGGASKSVSLPPQPVARNGTVSVPYVGQVKVAGLTPAEVQATIEAGLKDKAIEPQVLVTVTGNASTSVSVAGDVGQPGRIPLSLAGDRLLDVLAAAGGATAPAYDSFVRLSRGGRTATISLAAIVEDPAQNIFVRPDDVIYVVTDPQVFTAFGATARNASIPFATDRLTLAEAVGRAGGPLDNRADPRGVFVFRYETPEAYALASQDPGHKAVQASAGAATAEGVPVIYQLDLQDPASLFAAQRFIMRDNDVLYISNAPSTDLQKVFGIVSGGVGTAASAARLASE